MFVYSDLLFQSTALCQFVYKLQPKTTTTYHYEHSHALRATLHTKNRVYYPLSPTGQPHVRDHTHELNKRARARAILQPKNPFIPTLSQRANFNHVYSNQVIVAAAAAGEAAGLTPLHRHTSRRSNATRTPPRDKSTQRRRGEKIN